MIKRNFILGDKWLYYKVFCGKRTADAILIDIIKPLSEQLLDEQLIEQWFFIRYSDPKPHLRLRFNCMDASKLEIIINKVNNSFVEYIDNRLIWNIQTDTYSRELKRYGYNSMEQSENIFYINSVICINALNLIEDDELLFLFMLRLIDSFLNIANFELEEKISFAKHNFEAFKKEFNTDKNFNKQLNLKHQKLRKKIENFIIQPHDDFTELTDLISNSEPKLKQIMNDIIVILENENITLKSLLSSHIHMMVNRLFRDRQRLYELVCYSSLYRFYQFQKNTNV